MVTGKEIPSNNRSCDRASSGFSVGVRQFLIAVHALPRHAPFTAACISTSAWRWTQILTENRSIASALNSSRAFRQ